MTRLTVVLCLDVASIAGLVLVGLRAHSLGVLAEGGDYMVGALAIATALVATWLAARSPTAKHPLGHPRATHMAALVNAGWLLVLMAAVAVAAIGRLIHGSGHVHGLPVLIVSGVAALTMFVGALILGGDLDDTDDGDDLHIRAVLLDTAADAAAAAGVAITGAVIYLIGGWYWLDPTVALAIAAVIGYHTARLLRQVISALRRSPATQPESL